MLHKIIYKLGESIRNPSLKNNYNFLKKSQLLPIDKLEKYQLKKLKELLWLSYNNSEFYRCKINEVGFSIKKLNSLEDLKKLPILTKEDLIKYNEQIHTNIN